jgi:hypothetical protein
LIHEESVERVMDRPRANSIDEFFFRVYLCDTRERGHELMFEKNEWGK